MNHSLRILSLSALSVVSASLAHSAVIFQPNFDAPDYAPGSLADQPGWSFANKGTFSWYIAEPNSTSPKTPTALENHPASLSGRNLFWIAARTEGLSSTTNTARLTFSSTPITESFSTSLDLFVGPQGGSAGSVFNFALSQGETVGSQPVRFWLHGGGSVGQDVRLRFSSGGTSEVFLPEQNWYRITLDIEPTTATSGTWGLSVYALDPEGNITKTLYSISGKTYSGIPAGGFDTLLFQTVSNRSDFWVDNILVQTASIPEPQTASILVGGAAMLAVFGCRRR
jgi:hypothetical protein